MSIFRAILSFLRQATMSDLTKVSAPTLFCLPESSCMIFGTKRLLGFQEIRQIHKLDDSFHRMLMYLQFYLAGFNEDPVFGKKPLNSILGETFIVESAGGTRLIAEQVSHHPPITAFQFNDVANHRFIFKGNLSVSASFGGNSVTVKANGPNKFTVFLDDPASDGDRFSETYVSRPSLCDAVAKGLLIGRKRIELNGEVEITCEETKLRARLQFYDNKEVEGEVFENDSLVATLHGRRLGIVKIKLRGRRKSDRPPCVRDGVLLDYNALAPIKSQEFVLDEQCGKDSRRVWGKVIKRIQRNSFADADYIKREIEDRQRDYLAALYEADVEHDPFFMCPIEGDDSDFELNEIGARLMAEAPWFGTTRGKQRRRRRRKGPRAGEGPSASPPTPFLDLGGGM